MSKRYEFTGKTKEFYGRTLHQIRSLVTIAALSVSPGDLGGWIESEANLPHEGTAWVFPKVKVCDEATFWGGTFWGGTFRGGTFEGGTFWGGTFWGGTFSGGTFSGGTFEGGTFSGGTFEGGTFKGGTFWGGTFWGGTFRGGTFEGGTFKGGTFRGGTTVEKQPVFIAGLQWNVTITDNHMTIGCQHHTLADWWVFDDDNIKRMDARLALDFWKVYKPTLRAICAATGRVSE